jgi:hypothetical protein
MAIDTQKALEAVASAIATGKSIKDEAKQLTRYTAAELRDMLNLESELSDPNSAPRGRILRARRVTL